MTVTNPIDSVMQVSFRQVEEGDDDFDKRTADVSRAKFTIFRIFFLDSNSFDTLSDLVDFKMKFIIWMKEHLLPILKYAHSKDTFDIGCIQETDITDLQTFPISNADSPNIKDYSLL